MAEQTFDPKDLDDLYGVDNETQEAADKLKVDWWKPHKDGTVDETKLVPKYKKDAGEGESGRVFWDERMQVERVSVLPNTKFGSDEPDGHVAIITLKVTDPKSPNEGRTLDHRIYLRPDAKSKATALDQVQTMLRAAGNIPMPKGKDGGPSIGRALKLVESKRFKVSLTQGYKESWNFEKQERNVGDWKMFSVKVNHWPKSPGFKKP